LQKTPLLGCRSSQRLEVKLSVSKDQRISRLVEELSGAPADSEPNDIAEHPCYTGFFRCWNEQRYYEAHDVLEHLWLRTESDDADYFKGLIQAAGGFVHLQKQFERPTHPKDGRRLHPAVRLFRLAAKNLQPFAPCRHRFDLEKFLQLLVRQIDAIVASDYRENPWRPARAPQISLTMPPDFPAR
jgi:predicted metal-dependent hydrolase